MELMGFKYFKLKKKKSDYLDAERVVLLKESPLQTKKERESLRLKLLYINHLLEAEIKLRKHMSNRQLCSFQIWLQNQIMGNKF